MRRRERRQAVDRRAGGAGVCRYEPGVWVRGGGQKGGWECVRRVRMGAWAARECRQGVQRAAWLRSSMRVLMLAVSTIVVVGCYSAEWTYVPKR